MFATLTKRNAVLILIIILLLLYKLFLAATDFPSSFTNGFQRGVIVLVSVILLLNLKAKWEYKLPGLLLYLFLTFMIGEFGLWKFSAKRYLAKREIYFTKTLNEVRRDSLEYSIYSISKEKPFIRSYGKADSSHLENRLNVLKNPIGELADHTDVIQVEKGKDIVLFVFDRFIDNGYGLAHITPGQLEEIQKSKRYRVNGYDITGVTLIEGNWYYLSFT